MYQDQRFDYGTVPQRMQTTHSMPNFVHQSRKHDFSRSPQFVQSDGTSIFSDFEAQRKNNLPHNVVNYNVPQSPNAGRTTNPIYAREMHPAQGRYHQLSTNYPAPKTPIMATIHPDPVGPVIPAPQPVGVGFANINSYGDLPILHSVNKQIEKDISTEIGVPAEVAHGEDMNGCLDHFLKNMWDSQQYKEASLTESEEKDDNEKDIKSVKQSDFVPPNEESKVDSGPVVDENAVPEPNPETNDTEDDPNQQPEGDGNIKTDNANDSVKETDMAKDENADAAPEAVEKTDDAAAENADAVPEVAPPTKTEEPKTEANIDADE